MVVRKEKKRKKYLGTRTRGAGKTENRRGAGSKGGKGRTGAWRHKKSRFIKDIGSKVKLKPKKIEKAITLMDLNQYVESLIKTGKIDKGNIVLDFAEDPFLKKYDKVVSKGQIDYKVVLKNVKCSAQAKERIEAKGGSVE